MANQNDYKDNYVRRLRNAIAVDGDTIQAEVDLGFGVMWSTMGLHKNGGIVMPTFRVYGVDTPETSRRGSWDQGLSEEDIKKVIAIGHRARTFTSISLNKAVSVHCFSPGWAKDSFGRILAHIYILDRAGTYYSLADSLIDARLAVPYETRKTTTPVTTLIQEG